MSEPWGIFSTRAPLSFQHWDSCIFLAWHIKVQEEPAFSIGEEGLIALWHIIQLSREATQQGCNDSEKFTVL